MHSMTFLLNNIKTNQPHSPYWEHLLMHFLFCRLIVIDSESSTLAQDTVGIITISWGLMSIFFSFFRDQLHLV